MIWTFGYHGRFVDDLKRWLEAQDGTLLDIRMSPRSRNPQWNQAARQKTLGARYRHVPALGNANYRERGGVIKIADLEKGLRIVLGTPGPVVLMCQCPKYATCHRAVVAEALHARDISTEELLF